MSMPQRLSDVQAMAVALERLRVKVDAVLTAHAQLKPLSSLLQELEEAFGASGQDTHTHLLWARSVLGSPPAPKPLKETFDQIRLRAARSNVFVHYVHTFEGTEYKVYRGTTKLLARTKTPDRCVAVLRSILKCDDDGGV